MQGRLAERTVSWAFLAAAAMLVENTAWQLQIGAARAVVSLMTAGDSAARFLPEMVAMEAILAFEMVARMAEKGAAAMALETRDSAAVVGRAPETTG